MNLSKVAIVIPEHREKLTDFEQISLIQCFRILGKHPIIFAFPKSLNTALYEKLAKENNYNFKCIRFSDSDFCNYAAYNRLLVSPKFYKAFINYEYMLLYQTDCFIFKDELLEWCNKGLDYIGPPWKESFEKAQESSPFIGVGNGGFSLRKIATHLKVLQSWSLIYRFKDYFNPIRDKDRTKFTHTRKFFYKYLIGNNTHHLLNYYRETEDMFWGLYANRSFNWFKVASIEEGIQFGFETVPHQLYELNNKKLPFGCHAWWTYDLAFWKPYITDFGYSLG